MDGAGVAGLVSGRNTHLVGIEDQDDGGLRLYVGYRSDGIYALVYDTDLKAEVRRMWSTGQPCVIPTPSRDELFYEEGR